MATAKKIMRIVPKGKITVFSSFNNTIISAADLGGNVIAWASAGTTGFKGTKKSTPFSATQTMRQLVEKVKPYGLKEVEILVKGVGPGREASLRGLSGSGIQVSAIKDATPIPHGGPRPKSPRRV